MQSRVKKKILHFRPKSSNPYRYCPYKGAHHPVWKNWNNVHVSLIFNFQIFSLYAELFAVPTSSFVFQFIPLRCHIVHFRVPSDCRLTSCAMIQHEPWPLSLTRIRDCVTSPKNDCVGGYITWFYRGLASPTGSHWQSYWLFFDLLKAL